MRIQLLSKSLNKNLSLFRWGLVPRTWKCACRPLRPPACYSHTMPVGGRGGTYGSIPFSKASIDTVTEEDLNGMRLKHNTDKKTVHSYFPEAESGSVPQATREPPKPENGASLLNLFSLGTTWS